MFNNLIGFRAVFNMKRITYVYDNAVENIEKILKNIKLKTNDNYI